MKRSIVLLSMEKFVEKAEMNKALLLNSKNVKVISFIHPNILIVESSYTGSQLGRYVEKWLLGNFTVRGLCRDNN